MPAPRTTPTSITVRELIERLQDEHPEAQIIFACDFGDIGHSMQVFFLRGEVEEQEVEPSAYADSGWALRDRSEEDEDDEERELGPAFLVLS